VKQQEVEEKGRRMKTIKDEEEKMGKESSKNRMKRGRRGEEEAK
jgi:hypothetical protein